jgi:predicted nucleotidyltransferase
VPRVREVWIFGSYAPGALEVGDVDLAVEFDQTKDEAGRCFATLMAGGFDHLGALRRELRGNQRALEIHFNELDDLRKEGFEPRLLWRRGSSLKEAHARLAALAPDTTARRTARDTVHPLLADDEKLTPSGRLAGSTRCLCGRAGSTPSSSSCRRSRRRAL